MWSVSKMPVSFNKNLRAARARARVKVCAPSMCAARGHASKTVTNFATLDTL